jgi:predicted dehydrogenase
LLVRSGDVVIPRIDAAQPLDAECQHFLDCIDGKSQPINDGEVGLRVVAALEAAQNSMRNRSVLTTVGRSNFARAA